MYRKKIGFPVCKKENFAGLQAHRKRGKSARASPTPHHTLNEERSARFTAQHLSALVTTQAYCNNWPLERKSSLFSESGETGNCRERKLFKFALTQDRIPVPGIACSRLRGGGGKSFSNKKCKKRGHRPLSQVVPILFSLCLF